MDGLKMEHEDLGQLVDGLAVVALSALADIPVAGAILEATMPFLRSRLQRRAETRRQQQQVADAIKRWTIGENLGDNLAVGLAIATHTMAEHGLSDHDFKEHDFNPQAGTLEIIRRARHTDQGSWAKGGSHEDDAHVIARRAIQETLAALVSRRFQIEATILSALRKECGIARAAGKELAQTIAEVRGTVNDNQCDLRALTGHLTAAATRGDLMIYLEQRIDDWDQSPWLRSRRPSELERRLFVSTRGERSEHLQISEALERFPHLVILGGPGAGKTWLSRKIVRDVAISTLTQLKRGADLASVEFPLMTTWDLWTGYKDNPRSGLISASFAAGLGHRDLGDTNITDRIVRSLKNARNVIVVVDSLDGSERRDHAARLITELQGIQGWRTVITSRLGAWDEKESTRTRKHGVVILQPLSWENDVQPWIAEWFRQDPQRAKDLIETLANNPQLKQSASVPLLLTFYCLLAERAHADSPFPKTRRKLYDSIITLLLRGDWAEQSTPTMAKAKNLLARWAWRIAEDADPATGLGAWRETFVPDEDPPADIARSIDNVAPAGPPLGANSYYQDLNTGEQQRQFRHRTLLEHLVAEQISQMSVNKAAKVLLPHLWFDPDWQFVAPAALTAHPLRDQLLTRVLALARSSSGHSGTAEADCELDKFLLGAAADSLPEEWSPDRQELFHELRIKYAASEPELIGQTVHWSSSNAGVLKEVLSVLPSFQYGEELSRVATVVPLLVTTAKERRAAADVLMDVLRTCSYFIDLGMLSSTLMILISTPADRSRVLKEVLGLRKEMSDLDWSQMAGILPELTATPEERELALTALLSVCHLGPSEVLRLSEAMLKLTTDHGERRRALVNALAIFRYSDENMRASLATIIAFLDPELTDRQHVVKIVVASLPNLSGHDVVPTLKVVAALTPSLEERLCAIGEVLEVLPRDRPWMVSLLCELLCQWPLELASKHDFLRPVVQVVLDALCRAEPQTVPKLVAVLQTLEPSPDEWQYELDRVLLRFDESDPSRTVGLVVATSVMADTFDERREANAALLALLPRTTPKVMTMLVQTLSHSKAEPPEIREAANVLLNALPNAGMVEEFLLLMDAFFGLRPTDPECRRAVGVMLDRLVHQPMWIVEIMLGLTSDLSLQYEERRRLIAQVIATLECAFCDDGNHVFPEYNTALFGAIPSLAPTRCESDLVIALILDVAPHLPASSNAHIFEPVPALNPSPAERHRAISCLQAALNKPLDDSWIAPRLVQRLRQLSTVDDWCAWLRRQEKVSSVPGEIGTP